MNRHVKMYCAVAALSGLLTGANKPPREVFASAKSPAEATACLADQIGEFDSPQVLPSAGGRTRITTHIMHVTRIDLTVVAGEQTAIELRSKPSKQLRKIIQACR